MVNPVRGEVEVTLGDKSVVRLATTMRGLATISTALGCSSLGDLYQRMIGVELNTVYTILRSWTVSFVDADGQELKGPAAREAAVAAYLLSDSDAMMDGLSKLMLAFTRQRSSGIEDDVPGKDLSAQS